MSLFAFACVVAGTACSGVDADTTELATAEALARRVIVVQDASKPSVARPHVPAAEGAHSRAFHAVTTAFYDEHVAAGEGIEASATVELAGPFGGVLGVVVAVVESLEPDARPRLDHHAFHFDWVTGRRVLLADLVTDVRAVVDLAVPSAEGEEAPGPTAEGDEILDETWWTITPTGLCIEIPAGSMGAEVEGPKRFELAWQRFASLRTEIGKRVWRERP